MKTKSVYDPLEKQYSDILDLAWGFEVGPGWLNLITKLLKDISDVPKLEKRFKIVQIKEKFGGLNVHVRHARDEVFELIEVAERASYEICESCGEKGTLRRKSYIRVECDACAKERKRS